MTWASNIHQKVSASPLANVIINLINITFPSPAGMHSSGCTWHGRLVPGKIWSRKDGCVCVGDSATVRARQRRGLGARALPHPRVGVPN